MSKTAEQLKDEALALLAEARKKEEELKLKEDALNKQDADLTKKDSDIEAKRISVDEDFEKFEKEKSAFAEKNKELIEGSKKRTLESIDRFLGGEKPRDVARKDSELREQAVGTSKKERENLKSKDFKGYEKLKEKSQIGLPKRFSLLENIDIDDKKLDQLKNVTSVVESMEDLKNKLEETDLTDVFTIPSAFKSITTSDLNNEWVPTDDSRELNLFKDYNQVDLDTVRKATAWYNKYGQIYHVENVKWSGQAILNSCTTELRSKMVEAIRELPESEKGGPTYLMMMIRKIIATSDTALRGLTKKLETLKLTDYDGENVLDCVTFVRNAVKIMRDHASIPHDIKSIILEIFGATTCVRFEQIVSAIRTELDLKRTDYEIEDILKILEEDYQDKIGSGKWTPKGTDKVEGSTFSVSNEDIMCLNCGEFGHMVKDCTKPICQLAIAKRKKLLFNFRGKGGDSDKGDKKTNKKGKKNESNSDKPKDPKKQPPKAGEEHEKIFDGQKLWWCGKCGKWTNHKTKDHKPKKPTKDTEENGNNETEPQGNVVFGGATTADF